MRLNKGSTIMWSSAAGILVGTITDIHLDKSAAGNIVPWIIVKREDTGTSLMLCGTDDNLKGMKVKVLQMETA